jgi:CHAT domain-containing protein
MEELKYIQKHLGDRKHVVLKEREGTKRHVMTAIPDSTWIHLACHGILRPNEPTKSGYFLEDGILTLEDILNFDLPRPEFAFLSACHAIVEKDAFSNEVMHIAGGMMFAGFLGVVASMWSIEDNLAPEVVDEFYHRIMQAEGRPDHTKAAEALHYSVQKLRQKEDISITSWIPFIHFGV